MQVYTTPGYEPGSDSYPVFYLLHGVFDSDAAWSSVGRAGFIVDNLIAAAAAKPMIVVMPDGHTSRFTMGRGGFSMEDFVRDWQTLRVARARARTGFRRPPSTQPNPVRLSDPLETLFLHPGFRREPRPHGDRGDHLIDNASRDGFPEAGTRGEAC